VTGVIVGSETLRSGSRTMIGIIASLVGRLAAFTLFGTPDVERCVYPSDAEAQVPEEVPPSGVPMGGIGSRQPVNKPGSSSFLLKEAAF